MRKYLSGTEPGLTNLVAIARATGVSLSWLATGEGDKYGTLVAPDALSVPIMSIVASAGDGASILKEEVQEYMALSNALVRALRLTPADTFIIFARGESMEPLIRGGEPILCSRAERHLKASDGIYVLRLEGDILVKHMQRLPGGKVRVFSENPSYAPFEITLGDGVDFAVLGKVLHTLRQV